MLYLQKDIEYHLVQLSAVESWFIYFPRLLVNCPLIESQSQLNVVMADFVVVDRRPILDQHIRDGELTVEKGLELILLARESLS